MTDKLTRIKARIRALLDKTVAAGCTEAEALAAAELAAHLIWQYNLNINDVEEESEHFVTASINHDGPYRRPVDFVAVAIATFTNCKVWNTATTKQGIVYVNYFGNEMNALMAVYLYDMIDKAIRYESNVYKRSLDHRSRDVPMMVTSFQIGMQERLNERLREILDETNVDNTKSENAVMVLRNQLVTEAFAEIIGKNADSVAQDAVEVEGNALNAGRAAAEKINLSRPLDAPKKAKGADSFKGNGKTLLLAHANH